MKFSLLFLVFGVSACIGSGKTSYHGGINFFDINYHYSALDRKPCDMGSEECLERHYKLANKNAQERCELNNVEVKSCFFSKDRSFHYICSVKCFN